MEGRREVVLITGGAGFFGQHLVRELQVRNQNIAEIRVLDLKPYRNNLSYDETIPVVSIIGDICNKKSITQAFKGVSCVFHCAAYISYQYPPNYAELKRNNVEGTRNVIALCREFDVSRLVFTSSAEVTFVAYFGHTFVTLIVNQTEKKALPPSDPRRLIIPGYAASKLQAEQLVLQANGAPTHNGGRLRTVALRPSLMYGEEDCHFMTPLVAVAHRMGGRIPKIAGTGGKQQVVYAGNVAWSHICAMNTLLQESEEISGLPVFVTDDTVVADTSRVCERLTREPDSVPLCRSSWWSLPLWMAMLLAILMQGVSSLSGLRLPVSPVGLISYLGSYILFSRLRASIHMNYSPIYSEDEAFKLSSRFYTMYYRVLDKVQS